MSLTLRKITLNTHLLKLFSITIGFFIWTIISQLHITTIKYSIPLFFYNIPQEINIKAPEFVTIELRGTKKVLRQLNLTHLAAHIDIQNLKLGDNVLALSKQALFLPASIELLHTQPSPIVISLTA